MVRKMVSKGWWSWDVMRTERQERKAKNEGRTEQKCGAFSAKEKLALLSIAYIVELFQSLLQGKADGCFPKVIKLGHGVPLVPAFALALAFACLCLWVAG